MEEIYRYYYIKLWFYNDGCKVVEWVEINVIKWNVYMICEKNNFEEF